MISAEFDVESPLPVYGPGSNFADHTLLDVTEGDELILACGQSYSGDRGRDPYRFTPARAGTMTVASLRSICKAVHPRACGDN